MSYSERKVTTHVYNPNSPTNVSLEACETCGTPFEEGEVTHEIDNSDTYICKDCLVDELLNC